MFTTLRALFEQHVARFAAEPDAAHSLELAGAALLMEISRADHDVAAIERDAIKAAMAEVFHLSSDEITDIMDAAETAVDEAVSLFDFTAIINQQFSPEQKIQLLEMLWAVAYADNDLDHYEEYYVRKIADLLYISHGDYIRTKLKLMPG